ncbi:MAG: EGF domain-containing protein, partial [Myxococcota bacterium]
ACADVDECAEGLDDCAEHATCTNTVGGWECACEAGYEGDGTACADVDECAEGLDDCAEHATCTNTVGGWECACEAGYEGDGTACADVDECAEGLDDCAEHATCTNTVGGWECACEAGYEGDGTACTLITVDLVGSRTAADPGRWEDGTHAASCDGYRHPDGKYVYDGAVGSGVYRIDPDGPDPGAPFRVYCDMSTDGGGWTRVGRLYAGSRTIGSVYRGDRFFHRAWTQGGSEYALATNGDVLLDGGTYGMIDARTLIGRAGELRFSCEDVTRGLEADAVWQPTEAQRATWSDSLVYDGGARPVRLSANGSGWQSTSAYPTNTPATFYGSWHICGRSGGGSGGFQTGLCHNGPTSPDNGISGARQIAIGYHVGYAGLRLECTADTPSDTSLIAGTWEAWVR